MAKSDPLCWFCAHFYYFQAWPGTTVTPGDDFGLTCGKRHWEFDAQRTTQEQFSQILSTAATCPDFEDTRDGK